MRVSKDGWTKMTGEAAAGELFGGRWAKIPPNEETFESYRNLADWDFFVEDALTPDAPRQRAKPSKSAASRRSAWSTAETTPPFGYRSRAIGSRCRRMPRTAASSNSASGASRSWSSRRRPNRLSTWENSRVSHSRFPRQPARFEARRHYPRIGGPPGRGYERFARGRRGRLQRPADGWHLPRTRVLVAGGEKW